eukprot:8083310-Alexandrium_andersonii.AAC.1
MSCAAFGSLFRHMHLFSLIPSRQRRHRLTLQSPRWVRRLIKTARARHSATQTERGTETTTQTPGETRRGEERMRQNDDRERWAGGG